MKTTISSTMKKVILVLFASISLMSCKKDDNSKGSVAVKMTDGPFPYNFVAEANLSVAKVELRNKDTGEYVVVHDHNATVNIANYRNGETVEVSHQEVPNGTYDQARITISGAEVTLNNNQTYNANISSAQTIEVPIQPELTVDNSSEDQLLLDVDLSDSFTFSGPFGGWISSISQITGISSFNADIRATNLSETGSISGTVMDSNGPVANAEVTVSYDYTGDGNPDTVVAVTDENGKYKIIGLPQGNYQVEVETQSQTDQDSCSVSVRHDSNVNFVLP